jgi:hypothetical protein
VEHGDGGAAVIKEEIFEIPQEALEQHSFNPFPAEGFQVSLTIVRRLNHDVTGVAQRLKQLQKGFEELLARDGGNESRELVARAGVSVGVMPIPGFGDDP